MRARSWIPLLALLGLAASADCADTVFLKDGREIEAAILGRAPAGITLRDLRAGGVMTLKRSEIDLILKSEAPPPVEARPAPPAVRAPRPPSGPAEKPAAAAGAATQEEQPLPPKVQAVVDEELPRLAGRDPDERAAARRVLLDQGPALIPTLVKGLRDPSPELRTECAGMLGDLHALNAVKALIETFHAAMPEEGQAAAYQRYFVRALSGALAKLTGQGEYATVLPKSPLVQRCLEQNVRWYNENFERLPRQVGEPVIAPTDPLYAEKLAAARKLNLEKSTWSRPPLSADLAVGRMLTLPPAAPTTTSPDREFAKSIPRVDHRTMGGFLRPADVEFGKRFFEHGSEFARYVFRAPPGEARPFRRY